MARTEDIKITALYERLSRDDEQVGESNRPEEVHEARGAGSMDCGTSGTDIYFNFIGSYYPPCETISEEERIAAIDAEQLRKKQEKGKRASERHSRS